MNILSRDIMLKLLQKPIQSLLSIKSTNKKQIDFTRIKAVYFNNCRSYRTIQAVIYALHLRFWQSTCDSSPLLIIRYINDTVCHICQYPFNICVYFFIKHRCISQKCPTMRIINNFPFSLRNKQTRKTYKQPSPCTMNHQYIRIYLPNDFPYTNHRQGYVPEIPDIGIIIDFRRWQLPIFIRH